MTVRTRADLEFIEHWPHGPAPAYAEELVRFWMAEQAFETEAKARERLTEVVLHARDNSGVIAAVCTAAPMVLPRLGEPMYYYRSLVARDWHSSAIVVTMLERACVVLEDYAVANAYPCIGIVLELANAAFEKFAHSPPVWPSPAQRGFVYIGRSRDGHDLRILYFRGSRLQRLAPPIR